MYSLRAESMQLIGKCYFQAKMILSYYIHQKMQKNTIGLTERGDIMSKFINKIPKNGIKRALAVLVILLCLSSLTVTAVSASDGRKDHGGDKDHRDRDRDRDHRDRDRGDRDQGNRPHIQ
jgi:hypothetical protein